MINYIDKGDSLQEALRESRLAFIASIAHLPVDPDIPAEPSIQDEAEIQAIIDNHDPLPYEREEAKKRIIQHINKEAQGIENAYPEIEKKLFPYQRLEVESWKLDNTSATPTIDAIALKRGADRSEHLANTVVKVDAYSVIASDFAGERQRLEDIVDASTDWEEIAAILPHPKMVVTSSVGAIYDSEDLQWQREEQ